MNPRVTVLLPVRDQVDYLREAVASLLRQTLRDIEVHILDDASTDAAAVAAVAGQDPRIRLVRRGENIGLTRNLNAALPMAKSEYIARMDADDVALPWRLERQVAFMDRHPEIAICGGWVRRFGHGRPFVARYPCGKETVRAYALFDNPLAHPAVLLRRSAFEQAGLTYDESVPVAQDYDLWARALDAVDADNLDQVVLDYRVHGGSVSSARAEESNRQALRIQGGLLSRMGVAPTDEERLFHRRVGHGSPMETRSEMAEAGKWLLRIEAANRVSGRYVADGLRGAIGFVWLRVALNTARRGRWVISDYWRFRARRWHRASPSELGVLVASALLPVRRTT